MSIFFTRFLSPYGMQRNVLWLSSASFSSIPDFLRGPIDNFYPVLLIGILYNFIVFQNLLCFLIVHLNKTCKKTRLYINRKTSFLFSTIISFLNYSLRQHHPVIRKLAAADFFKLRQQICNLQILLLFS